MSNLLIDKYPNIAKEFDFDKNTNVDLNEITYGSSKKIWWICKKGHSYQSIVKDRSHGHGCNVCSGRIPTHNKLAIIVMPEIIKEFNKGKNIDIGKLSYGSSKKVWWICESGHDYRMSMYDRYRGRGCSICSRNIISDSNRLKVLFPNIFNELDLEKNVGLNINDISYSSNKKVWWVCPKGHSYHSSPNSRMSGKICGFCTNKNVCEDNCLLTLNPELAKEWHSKNKIKPNEVLPFSMKRVWWVCENGHEWKTTVANRSSGRGCGKCSKRISKLSQNWLDYIGVSNENREIKIIIKDEIFFVDGYDPSTNTVYEFNGDYWHGNPKKYDSNKINSHNNKTFGELYNKTVHKQNKLISNGFNVVSIWESEWKKKV